jgi:hypothetical protein
LEPQKVGFRIGMIIALMGTIILLACSPKTSAPLAAATAPNPAWTALSNITAEFHRKVWQEFPRRYSTPDEAAAGIARDYGWNVIPSSDFLGNFYSPLVTFSHLERQCDETALLVAYAVADDGYPPLIMFLYSENQNYIGVNHALFVFQKNGLWGYTDWTHYVPPQFKDIEELFYTYQRTEPSYVSYMLFDFDKYDGDWKGATKPLIVSDDIVIAKGPTSIWLFRTPIMDEAGTTTQAVRLVAVNSGSVNNQNVISSAILAGVTTSCCGLPPTETEALMTFDLSPIPKDAQVVSVMVDFRQFMFYGEPFTAFRCLEVFKEDFNDIRMVKFEQEPEGFVTRWCTQRDLSIALYIETFRNIVQNNLDNSTLQLRLKFKLPEGDTNIVGNQMIFNPDIMLVVTYSLPK